MMHFENNDSNTSSFSIDCHCIFGDAAMDLKKDFAFAPLPPIPPNPTPPIGVDIPHIEAFVDPSAILKAAKATSPLGPLQHLPGTWRGKGLNMIWRPHHAVPGDPPNQDRFLEINVTDEQIEFEEIPGNIPNRGLLQPDIDMFGMRYLQQIADANVKVAGKPAGLHIEPGIWAVVPITTDPKEPNTVVRMGSIPHGTTILAQGVATPPTKIPKIDDINILPFPIGGGLGIHFPEQDLSKPTKFRSPPSDIKGVTQQTLDNPNLVLKNAIAHATIVETTTLVISTDHSPVAGGGTANTVFLQGISNRPNANASKMTAIFWIETLADPKSGQHTFQLQYSQTVLLDFAGLSWPHVTVGTLLKVSKKHVS